MAYRFARLTRTVLIMSIMCSGCHSPAPTGLTVPSPPPPPAPAAPLAVRSVTPHAGPVNSAWAVQIFGSGFQPGATVSLGGPATNVIVVSSVLITATTPIRSAGAADVVVTNADGLSSLLTAGYIYDDVRLTTSSDVVAAGSVITVSWVAPAARSALDWVGLFRVGSSNTLYGWYDYTNRATSGTFQLTAPAQAGRYEFRYLLDDGYVDVARSREITVTASTGG